MSEAHPAVEVVTYDGLPAASGGAHRLRTRNPRLAWEAVQSFLEACVLPAGDPTVTLVVWKGGPPGPSGTPGLPGVGRPGPPPRPADGRAAPGRVARDVRPLPRGRVRPRPRRVRRACVDRDDGVIDLALAQPARRRPPRSCGTTSTTPPPGPPVAQALASLAADPRRIVLPLDDNPLAPHRMRSPRRPQAAMPVSSAPDVTTVPAPCICTEGPGTTLPADRTHPEPDRRGGLVVLRDPRHPGDRRWEFCRHRWVIRGVMGSDRPWPVRLYSGQVSRWASPTIFCSVVLRC